MQTKRFLSLSLIVFLVLAFIPLQAKATEGTFGETSTLPNIEGMSYIQVWACKYSCPDVGTATKISWRGGLDNEGYAKCAIYSDNSGTAETLLAVSDAVWVSARAWYNFSITYSLEATVYWLAFFGNMSSGSYGVFYSDTGTTGQTDRSQPHTYPSFPDPWTSYNKDAKKLNIYCTYTLSEGGKDLTFGYAENLFPSSTNLFNKELGFTSSNTIQPSDVVSMSKAIGGLLTVFLSTNSLYPSANLLFNKELAFWKIENIFPSATSTMSKALKITLYELFDFVKLHTSNIMLPTWLAMTIDVAVAIAVLALVLSITGISIVFLRRRRDQ